MSAHTQWRVSKLTLISSGSHARVTISFDGLPFLGESPFEFAFYQEKEEEIWGEVAQVPLTVRNDDPPAQPAQDALPRAHRPVSGHSQRPRPATVRRPLASSPSGGRHALARGQRMAHHRVTSRDAGAGMLTRGRVLTDRRQAAPPR